MNTKKTVRTFRKKYRLKVINSASLCEVLTEQGYTVVEYNGATDSDDVQALIDALHLQDQIAHSRCFVFQNDKYRLVFIHGDLNEAERTIALAHEEGHVWNRHMTRNSVFGEDVTQEYEANEFSHYLLNDQMRNRRRCITVAILCAIIMIAGAVSGILLKQKHDVAIYTENLYRTESGTKYHLRNCMYIKDKTDVYRLTRVEFESGAYTPCEACLPDGN